MRFTLCTLLLCCSAIAQQPPGLTAFLGLTTAQVFSVTQLNDAFTQFSKDKAARTNAVQAELSAEYAKPSPDPQALGQRYIEIDSIHRELAAERASVQTKVLALLTPAQLALVQNISFGIVQQSLVQDASCAYLADAIPIVSDTIVRVNSAFGNGFATIIAIFPNQGLCDPKSPSAIFNFLTLTDTQVKGIQAVQAGSSNLILRQENRITDLEVEVRDETAKSTLDPTALGVRYAELANLSQQTRQADQNARVAARGLLDSTQLSKLQTLIAAAALARYLIPAETCHFMPVPPGVVQADITQLPCFLN